MEKKDFILKLDNALSLVIELKNASHSATLMNSYLQLVEDILVRVMKHLIISHNPLDSKL